MASRGLPSLALLLAALAATAAPAHAEDAPPPSPITAPAPNSPTAQAKPDSDLDLIPTDVMKDAPAPSANPDATPAAAPANRTIYAEDAITLPFWRNNLLVPIPGIREQHWQNRLDLDIRDQERLSDDLTVNYSGRLNYLTHYDEDNSGPRNVRHDFREGYLSWTPLPETYLDLGRFNERNGVGYGFNPTDFFKTNSVPDRFSADPRVLREDRLGALMVRAQKVWEGGSVTMLYAPKVAAERPEFRGDIEGLNPSFDRTNAHDRLLIKSTIRLADDVVPEFLVYHDNVRTSFGANFTRGIGDATTAYLEWAGADIPRLPVLAYDDAINSGLYPRNIPYLFGGDQSRRFRNDVAAGLTYTLPINVTITLEYDFHQAGFNRSDFQHWFASGAQYHAFPQILDGLWQIRNYALNQGDPLGNQGVFLSAMWTDAVIRDLDVNGLVFMDPLDASVLAQVSADYHPNNHWSFGVVGLTTLGSRNSDNGSNPEGSSLLFSVARYF